MAFPSTNFISRVTTITAVWLQAVNDFIAGFAAETFAAYGAVGDGITDDSDAIQAAVIGSRVLNAGGYSKNYKVTKTIVVPSNTQIYGRGARIFQTTLQTPLWDTRSTSDVLITGFVHTGASMTQATAGNFVVGVKYSIISIGTTDFTLVGAASNTVGLAFTATGAGSGSGVASTFVNQSSSLDVCVRADYAVNLVVRDNTFNTFAYSAVSMQLWGTNFKGLRNTINGPEASVLNPLNLPDPSVPGFRNCTGMTILCHGAEIRGNKVKDTSQGFIIGQQSDDVLLDGNIIYNTVVEHGVYCDTGCVGIKIDNNSINNTVLVGAKIQYYDTTLSAPSILTGGTYVIQTVGTTDFTLIGAASNTVGVEFTATGVGTGTGVVRLPTPMNSTFIGNTLKNIGSDGLLIINTAPATIATITGATQANPGVITTAAAHGLAVGDLIDIGGVVGMTPLNSSWRVSTVPLTTTFTVRTPAGPVDTTSYPAYVSGGTVSRPTYGRNMIVANNTLKTIGQDGISIRYVDGFTVEGNLIETVGRVGIYQLIAGNGNTNGNLIRDVQKNGIYNYSPIDECSIYDNTLVNVGAAGIDVGGASSGILFEGMAGVTVEGNIVQGELTQTKMYYGIQAGQGDKSQWTIVDNRIIDAEGAIIALDTSTTTALCLLDRNVGTSAAGPDAITGLASALPNRGESRPSWEANAAPTTGFWPQESKVRKLTPATGDPTGWVNVSSGTPGTWRPTGMTHGCPPTTALQGSFTTSCSAATGITGGTAGVSFGPTKYQVNGAYCTAEGYFVANVTTVGTTITCRLTLPIAATLGTAGQGLWGMVIVGELNMYGTGRIDNNGVDDEAAFSVYSSGNGNVRFYYRYTYQLNP